MNEILDCILLFSLFLVNCLILDKYETNDVLYMQCCLQHALNHAVLKSSPGTVQLVDRFILLILGKGSRLVRDLKVGEVSIRVFDQLRWACL